MPQANEFQEKEKIDNFIEVELIKNGLSRKIHRKFAGGYKFHVSCFSNRGNVKIKRMIS